MFIKSALAAALVAGAIADKPAFGNVKTTTTRHSSHSSTTTFGNVKSQTTKGSNTKLSAAFHKNNMGWARRQVAHWNGMKTTHVVVHKHAHRGHHVQGYKWVKKSMWTTATAIVHKAHATYATCMANFHKNNGKIDMSAWKASPERRAAMEAL
jgi:hypothetical protein